VRADDGHGWGEWDSFELTTTTGVGAPTATVETQTIEQGAWRLLNTVLEASDPEGDTLTLYEVWDDEGSDSWWADGAVQDASAGFRTSDLSDIWFQGDSTAGSQELWVRAYDGEHWSTWDAFDLITV